MWTTVAVGLVLAVALAMTAAYCRGRKVGAAKQEGSDRREKVDEAVERGDTKALDREWERPR